VKQFGWGGCWREITQKTRERGRRKREKFLDIFRKEKKENF